MTHNLLEEHLTRLKDIPKLSEIGLRRMGSRINIRTLFRWATEGVCGVVLETTVQGSQRYTSVPALRRFFAAVTAAKAAKNRSNHAPAKTGEKKDPTAVESELNGLGI